MAILNYIDTDIFTPVYDNGLPRIDSPRIDAICKELYFAIKAREPIFLYGDYDMDGICCNFVWQEVLSTLYNVEPVVFQYVHRTHNIDPDIVNQAKRAGTRIVLICDTGSGARDSEILSLLRCNGHTPIVIDHHYWEGDYETSAAFNLIFNSYEERNLLGGYEVSGAYASLLVAHRLCDKYFHHSLSYNAMVFALASMYSDVVDMATPCGRALFNLVRTIKMPGPTLLQAMNTFNYSYCRRFFSFIVAPKINACFRTEEFGPLNMSLRAKDRYECKQINEELKRVHAYASSLVDAFIPMFSRKYFDGIALCTHNVTPETRTLHIRNFTGLIANRIAHEEKKLVVVATRDQLRYAGSFRDFYNRALLPIFKLFCSSDGHDAAFGLEFTNLREMERHLMHLSGIVDTQARKDYTTVSSSLIEDTTDIDALALYNEYMNVRPKIIVVHRCPYARLVLTTKYRKFYDVGLPYQVSGTLPLFEGSILHLEPAITKSVELRCVE